jgi:hypothetical protein
MVVCGGIGNWTTPSLLHYADYFAAVPQNSGPQIGEINNDLRIIVLI